MSWSVAVSRQWRRKQATSTRACRLLDPGACGRWPAGHAPGVAAHQHVVKIAQVSVDAQTVRERDAFEHLGDLSC